MRIIPKTKPSGETLKSLEDPKKKMYIFCVLMSYLKSL